MKIIGLTGGSGAGKSLAADCFRQLGAGVVDADAVYRRLCAESRPLLDALAAAFGRVLTAAGALDRARLAQIVFSDADKLRLLNEITFPYIRAASVQEFAALAAAGHAITLYDAPTLFQTGAEVLCEAVIGVVAARETRIRRIISRDRLSRAAAAARIDSQPDADFYRRRCQYILENDGTPDALCAQARALWARLTQEHTSFGKENAAWKTGEP